MADFQKSMKQVSSDGYIENEVISKVKDRRPEMIPVNGPFGNRMIGPRTAIVPADPIIWDNDTSYEYLTLVASEDFEQSYISKKDVPAGTPLTDTEYWIPAALFNAQLAALQKSINDLLGEYSEFTENVESQLEKSFTSQICTVMFLLDGRDNTPYINKFADICKAAKLDNVAQYAQWRDGVIQPSAAIIAEAYDALGARGIPCDTIKFHGVPTNPSTYYDEIKAYLTAIDRPFTYVIVYNECGESYISTNIATMTDVVQRLHSDGYKVLISANQPTLSGIVKQPSLYSLLDVNGINIYPSAGYTLTPTNEDIQRSAAKTFKFLGSTSRMMGLKDTWITEVGCLPYAGFYFHPEYYTFENMYPPSSTLGRNKNMDVMLNYYTGVIKACKYSVSRIYLWYFEQMDMETAYKLGAAK